MEQTATNAARFTPKQGGVVGGWHLVSRLGKGGNAHVWKARKDGQTAAIKILRSLKSTSASYTRFKDEIVLLEKLKGNPGVMRVLEYNVPESPTHDEPAWYTMPVADTIKKALTKATSLRSTVEAVQAYAGILAGLPPDVSHRDIKPDNLFKIGDQFVIGDFGIASFADKEELTHSTHKLGPIHFIPPEFLSDPKTAMGPPGDVYMLAKTFWVLATGQRYPFPGEWNEAFALGPWTSDKNAHYLDYVIQKCTQTDPDARPEMSWLEGQLSAWLNIDEPTSPTSVDASLSVTKIQSVFSEVQDRQRIARELDEGYSQLLGHTLARMKEVGRLIEKLTDRTPNIQSSQTVIYENGSGRSGSTPHEAVTAIIDCPTFNDVKSKLFFVSQISVCRTDDALTIRAVHARIVPEGRPNVDKFGVRQKYWYCEENAELGSPVEFATLDAIISGLIDALPGALEQFVDDVSSGRFGP